MNLKILIIDDEKNIRRVLSTILKSKGFCVREAASGEEALKIVSEDGEEISAVISDLKMPKLDGLELLSKIRALHPIPFIIITAYSSVDTAVQALKNGAFDYITKPFDREEILLVAEKATFAYCAMRNKEPRLDTTSQITLIGKSKKIEDIISLINRVADSPSSILIQGESGTGKELVARSIHQQSPRREKPFIVINCGAIPEALIESELFGHEKGAFTGAHTSKPGRFELAHEGTLFLDEIGDIPLASQVKLLRAIQEREFERVGGTKTIKTNIRIISATNRDLLTLVREGKFREDLFYRINVLPIIVPALCERKEDIPLLFSYFLQRFQEKLGKSVAGISPEALAHLQDYSWPGNIRELENLTERMVLLAKGNSLTAEDLPEEIKGNDAFLGFLKPTEDRSLKEVTKVAKESMERLCIEEALKNTDGNVTQAARKLGISRKSLQLKMKNFNLRQ